MIHHPKHSYIATKEKQMSFLNISLLISLLFERKIIVLK